MTRTEYRLSITWPARDGAEPHAYGKTFRQEPRAAKAASEYQAQGATVTVEVWTFEDGFWAPEVDRTAAISNGAWLAWGFNA